MSESTESTPIKAFKLKTDKRTGRLILTKLLDKQAERVVLPADIDVIGEDAFANAKRLREVVFNAGLSVIAEDAFRGCAALEAVELPPSVTEIAEDTFNGCAALTSVVVPASVAAIDEDAFYGCERLERVIYLGSEEQWRRIRIAQPNDCLLKAKIEYRE